MGFTYDPEYFDEADVNSWECLWSKDLVKFGKQFSLKDSYRDTYVAAIFHIFKDEIAALDPTDADYNSKLSKIFNRCDNATIDKVEIALKEAMNTTVYGLEVDEGKDDIVRGVYHANLAWSGDSVYSMDSAEEGSEKILNYSLPTEGSNVWFDGWCMPKGANKELAEEFVNYICMPEVAANCMDAVGYTSPIVGDAMWDLVNEWYAADKDEEETYTVDLSFYFGDSIEGKAEIKIPTSEKGRQFDAQYPTEEMLNRCCVMKDFGSQTEKVEAMWIRVNA
jgi:spermidine/putrescine transport system substrate-binding protein